MTEIQKIIFANFIETPPRYLSEMWHEHTAVSVMVEVGNFWERMSYGR